MGHLAWADAFVITADSISMLSEACSTGYVSNIMMSSRVLEYGPSLSIHYIVS